VPVQIFWARQKIELNFSAPPKCFVPAQKLNLLYENHLFGLAQEVWDWHNTYVNQFLVWHKQFGPAQNVLGPVKGQGIC
jgi:hypothetical protein